MRWFRDLINAGRTVTYGRLASFPGEFGNVTIAHTEVVGPDETPEDALKRAKQFVVTAIAEELRLHAEERHPMHQLRVFDDGERELDGEPLHTTHASADDNDDLPF